MDMIFYEQNVSSHLKDTTEHNERLRACLALALTFRFQFLYTTF